MSLLERRRTVIVGMILDEICDYGVCQVSDNNYIFDLNEYYELDELSSIPDEMNFVLYDTKATEDILLNEVMDYVSSLSEEDLSNLVEFLDMNNE